MSLVKNLDAAEWRAIILLFEKTYRLEHGRFVNKVGQEASARTIALVSEAQAFLADVR